MISRTGRRLFQQDGSNFQAYKDGVQVWGSSQLLIYTAISPAVYEWDVDGQVIVNLSGAPDPVANPNKRCFVSFVEKDGVYSLKIGKTVPELDFYGFLLPDSTIAAT